ncbi:hypothetical protein AAC387_Pa05g2309 [Persea americana]
MSSPAEFYNSLPPVIKAYGSLCLLTTTAYQLGLLNPVSFALIYDAVISRFLVWRLVTNFFFLGKFSIYFGICLLMMCVALASLFFDIFWKSKIWGPAREGPFERRTADFLWMMLFGAFSLLALSTIPPLWSPFLGHISARHTKGILSPLGNACIGSYFWFTSYTGSVGIIAGHLYYFLTVLHPLAGRRNILKTPIWVHKLVALWGVGARANAPVRPNGSAGVAFRGRSYKLDG